jgi:hypothetical protein
MIIIVAEIPFYTIPPTIGFTHQKWIVEWNQFKVPKTYIYALINSMNNNWTKGT